MLQDSIDVRDVLVKKNPNSIEFQSDLASSYTNIAVLFESRLEPDRALQAYLASLAIKERLARENPQRLDFVVSLGGNYTNLGGYLLDQGDFRKADEFCERGIEVLTRFVTIHPKHAEAKLFLLTSHNVRSMLFENQSRLREAITELELALIYDTGRYREEIEKRRDELVARAQSDSHENQPSD